MNGLRGVIFDLDGVLVHTDELHYQAWNAIAERLGITFSRDDNDRLRGVSRAESLDLVLALGTTEVSAVEKEVLADEKATTAIAFLGRAVAFYERHGITVARVMTDNGGAYRSAIHALACRALGIRHLRTRAYRPQTNGKACVLASWCRPSGRRGSPRPVV